MGDLSPHFNTSEFRSHDDGSLVGPTKNLIDALERLREICGGPLRVVSGYRSPRHNIAVNGAKKSQHLTGNAADLVPGYATRQQARDAGFTGIGYNKSGQVIHVDMRPLPPGDRTEFRDGW